ncbi:hypothetical protein LJB95_00720 [Paludibacteraceae bacterium OttesenSCG-928-F17]|nr:hypothetical protein [Paludibacteraceae bacterium OttesenSCG-928-F17]
MKSDSLYQELTSVIRERVPHKELVTMLSDLLIIEKEAIYRRLRGEVPFTFAEVAKISKKLNLSLDTIIGTTSENNKPFQLKLMNHANYGEDDFKIFDKFIELIKCAGSSKYSEFGFATSVLPLHSSCCYEALERFYILRWLYQFGQPGNTTPFKSIVLSERKKSFNKQFNEEVQNVKYTYFVWDRLTLFYLINDMHYFRKIHLLDDEDMVVLKNEIDLFVNDIEKIAIKGSYPNGNKIEIYISNISFETTYTYLKADDFNITFIKTFTLNETVSTDDTVYQKMKLWIDTLKRTSTLISGSNEIYRIQFFEKQRELIDAMFSKDFKPDELW